MGGNPDPPPNQYPNLPDPDQIDALAAQWLAEATTLDILATMVSGCVGQMVWTGDAQQAAEAAALAVANVIAQIATSANSLGQALENYASIVREAIKLENAAFWADLIGVIVFVLTIPFAIVEPLANGLIALISSIAGKIAEIGLASIEVATFSVAAAINIPIALFSDIGAQLIGDAIAGVPLNVAQPYLIPYTLAGALLPIKSS